MQRTGTAGWSLPAKATEEGTRLQRYARALPCVEINSTFYRAHRATTWARWAAETPADFRFSIKAPNEDDFLAMLAARIRMEKNAWVIFDNTALSHAYANALSLQRLIQKAGVESTKPTT